MKKLLNKPTDKDNDSSKRVVTPSVDHVQQVFTDVVKEKEERDKKKLNLVMFNIPETVVGTTDERILEDEKNISDIQKAIGSDVSFTQFKRIGYKLLDKTRPRPMMVKYNTFEDKLTVLRSARKLRTLSKDIPWNTVSIQHDLTKQQQQQNKQLVVEMKRRRQIGENVIIRGGQIINADHKKQQQPVTQD